ncbi:hypothetical protein [Klebsiella pneumoniae]
MTGYVKGLCSLPRRKTILELAAPSCSNKINEKTPLKVTYTTEEDGRLLFNFLDKKQ